MKLSFGYGKGEQTVEVPEKNLLGVLVANELEHERRGADAVRYALAHPISAPLLGESVRKKKAALGKDRIKIAIIASDISRPVPSYEILPSVIETLLALWLRRRRSIASVVC